MVHFKPEWHDEQQEHEKIGNRLRGKFTLSPFLDENAPLFPMRCMTHGFAEWTVRSSLDFAQWFAQLADIPNRFEKFIDQMDTTPK